MKSNDKNRAGDELTDLARLLPPPPKAELAPERHRHLKDVLMRQIDHDLAQTAATGGERHAEPAAGTAGTPFRGRVLRPRFLVPVAAALALAAGATVAVQGGGGQAPAPAAAPASGAVVLLNQIAAAAQHSPVGTKAPGADQYVYTRSLVRGNDGEFGGRVKLGATYTDERWMSQDPSPVTTLGHGRDSGKGAPMSGEMLPIEVSVPDGSKDDGALAPGLNRPTYGWLASLPTDPDALLKKLSAQVTPVKGRETRDQAVFSTVGDLVSANSMPPENAAAFYRAIARIPGVRKVPDAVDAAGRHGVGITLAHSAWADREVWIFDRDTLAYLGSRMYLTENGKSGRHEVLGGLDAVMQRGVVDRVGARPAKSKGTARTQAAG
ncbi:CU044_5270 family protein [Streptomyces sp. NPDC059740]|uniref:CU044_5270 family protein n=1 Tax=Streptomyces sp. NPDC059740 TaxID=3346926 RepID=UPI003647FAB9